MPERPRGVSRALRAPAWASSASGGSGFFICAQRKIESRPFALFGFDPDAADVAFDDAPVGKRRTLGLSSDFVVCPGRDLNPHSRCRERDFKSLASAGFATRACAENSTHYTTAAAPPSAVGEFCGLSANRGSNRSPSMWQSAPRCDVLAPPRTAPLPWSGGAMSPRPRL
jgi:hypothetical protein